MKNDKFRLETGGTKPLKVMAVYNYQTEHIESMLVSSINQLNSSKGSLIIDYTSECVNDFETLIGRPKSDEPDLVINLINYFPESFDYDVEHRLSFMHNVITQEAILELCGTYSNPLLLNLSLNNPFYLSLNDRFQADKQEIFMEHKIEQLSMLKTQQAVRWVNIEFGYLNTQSGDLFGQFGKEFLLNGTVNVNPIRTDMAINKLINFMLRVKPDAVYNETARLTSFKTDTLYSYFKNLYPTSKIERYIDFIEQNPYYNRYVRRFTAIRHISEL